MDISSKPFAAFVAAASCLRFYGNSADRRDVLADTPKRLLEKWSAPNRKPCPAGKTFGVIGPNGLYRTCLHALPERSRFERLMNMRKAQR